MYHIEWSCGDIMEMCRLYDEEYMSLRKIAVAYGVSVATVRYHLEKNGVQLRAPVRKLHHVWKEAENICDMYRQGMSGWDLSIMYKVSDVTIYKILEKHGVSRRTHMAAGRIVWSQEQIRDICERSADFQTQEDIACVYGVSTYSITKWLRDQGLRIRTSRETTLCIS